MSLTAVKREILVRHLEAWAPAALHHGRRAFYVHGYADADGGAAVEAAAEVLADQPALGRGRELSMLVVGDNPTPIAPRPGLGVHPLRGGDALIPVGLKALGAQRVPSIGYLDASAASEPPGAATLDALANGKPADLIMILAPGMTAEPRFPLHTRVELATDDGPGQLLIFGTTSGKSLESFKETLWAVDEFAGVRYRDPGDPGRHLIDISLSPHPGPLRRELLAHLERVGQATVTELRTFTMTETVYRAADATRVLHTLLDAGTLSREPSHGRLGGDVVVRL